MEGQTNIRKLPKNIKNILKVYRNLSYAYIVSTNQLYRRK